MGRFPGFWLSCILVIAVAATAQAQATLTIRVVQGDNAINSIRMRRGHDPAIQVLDSSGEPLSNATVSFLLPSSGPSATFGDSGLSVTVQTDNRGIAVGKGLIPNRIEGQFRIRATASWRGESANATLSQTNAEASATSSKRNKWIALAAVIGGAAAGGIVLATRGGSSDTGGAGSTGGGSTTTGTIVPGSPTFGPPR